MHRMHTMKLIAAGLALAMIMPAARLEADEPRQREASAGITISFVHPERQAAAVLRLFDGSRAAHPAAALAAWKQATRNPQQLGKRLEAVISFFNPEMSFKIAAPAPMAISATLAFCVSTEIGIFKCPRNASSTGSKRRSSSAAEMPAEPGRVDSAPTSRMSAPARSMASAPSTARLTLKNFPPSEKLSGVTFSTPIISVRSPRTSARERSFRRNRLRGGIGKGKCSVEEGPITKR